MVFISAMPTLSFFISLDTSLDVGLDAQVLLRLAHQRLGVVNAPPRLDVRLDFHSSSPVRSCCLSYDDKRRAIGFDVSVHRLSPGKAGMSGRIDHHRKEFSDQRRDR